MELYVRDLARMSRKEQRRALNEITRAATAHRDNHSRFMPFLHAIRWFVMGRVPR